MRRFAYCAVVTGTAMTALTGCGGEHTGDDKASPTSASSPAGASPLAAAYTNTVNSGSAGLSLTGEVTGGTTSTKVTGEGKISFKPPASSLTFSSKGKSTEIRAIGDSAYLRTSAGSWHKVEGDQMTGGITRDSSPTAGLSFLNSVTRTTPIGAATIRGGQAQGYRAAVDLNKVAAGQRSPAEQQVFRSLIKETGSSTLSVDIWLDAQKRVAREKYSVTFPTGKTPTTTTSTLDLYDYGTKVSITPPPDSAVKTTDTPSPG
ncbi:hypothetical protein FB559_6140 [Actinoallomurus bryophytorum]|uniref:Lipoprotein LprG n=2 Tax=Actinoallomurus bryophytorum TaxID=1490222 RepID=A0A543CTK1_9ACTN|nr:hypothetical protein FB559_6140 [Actinoallomurus bryophytorum]